MSDETVNDAPDTSTEEVSAPAPTSHVQTPAQVSAARKEFVESKLKECKRTGWVDRTLFSLVFDGLDSVENDDSRSVIEALGNKRLNSNPPDLRLSPIELNALHFEALRLRIVKAK